MSHSVDKVRWITVWILAEETAANSLIRNLGSEGRETLSCESEWENGAQWASASCEWEFVCGKVCVWSRHLLTYVQVRNQASFNTSALTIVVVLILLLIWAKLLIFRDQRTSSDIYIYIYILHDYNIYRWFAEVVRWSLVKKNETSSSGGVLTSLGFGFSFYTPFVKVLFSKTKRTGTSAQVERPQWKMQYVLSYSLIAKLANITKILFLKKKIKEKLEMTLKKLLIH